MTRLEKKLRERTKEYLERGDKAEIKDVDSEEENTGVDCLVHRPSQGGGNRSRKRKWIVIAQGGDGYKTFWHADFGAVMEKIGDYVRAIEWHKLNLDWEEICDRVSYLKDKAWNISKDRPWSDYWENFECTMDCILLNEEWDGGMPGQSENLFTLELLAAQKQSFLKTMRQLRASLAKYWKENQLPGP